MKIERRCRKCNHLVERDRPKQARYCKRCGIRRTSDWKREHPEIVKQYAYDERTKHWREKKGWNEYIRNWRKLNRQLYREQNKRHLMEFRARRRRINIALITILCILLITTSGFTSTTETQGLPVVIESTERMVIKITELLLLLFLCIRILWNDIQHFFTEIKSHRNRHVSPNTPIQNKENDTDAKVKK